MFAWVIVYFETILILGLLVTIRKQRETMREYFHALINKDDNLTACVEKMFKYIE